MVHHAAAGIDIVGVIVWFDALPGLGVGRAHRRHAVLHRYADRTRVGAEVVVEDGSPA